MRAPTRTLRFAVFALCVPVLLSAQQAMSNFRTGSKIASVGILTGGNYDGFGVGGTIEFGAISFNKNVHLGLGGSLGYVRNSEGSGSNSVTASVIPAMAIGNIHFSPASQPKLDLYAGVSAGLLYGRVSSDVIIDERRATTENPSVMLSTRRVGAARRESVSDTDFGFGIQAGAHFALTSSVSAMAQLGIEDVPLLYAGVSFRF
jgi:opacity protein-like surface antigen